MTYNDAPYIVQYMWTGPDACRKTADRNGAAADGKRAIGNGACGLHADGWRGGTGSSSIGVHANQGGRRQGAVQMTWSVRNSVSPRGPYTMVSGTVRSRTHTHTRVYIRTHKHTRTHLWYYTILHTCIIPLNKLADAINEQTICVRGHDSSVRRISTAGACIVCAADLFVFYVHNMYYYVPPRSFGLCNDIARDLLICITISFRFFLCVRVFTSFLLCTYWLYNIILLLFICLFNILY